MRMKKTLAFMPTEDAEKNMGILDEEEAVDPQMDLGEGVAGEANIAVRGEVEEEGGNRLKNPRGRSRFSCADHSRTRRSHRARTNRHFRQSSSLVQRASISRLYPRRHRYFHYPDPDPCRRLRRAICPIRLLNTCRFRHPVTCRVRLHGTVRNLLQGMTVDLHLHRSIITPHCRQVTCRVHLYGMAHTLLPDMTVDLRPRWSIITLHRPVNHRTLYQTIINTLVHLLTLSAAIAFEVDEGEVDQTDFEVVAAVRRGVEVEASRCCNDPACRLRDRRLSNRKPRQESCFCSDREDDGQDTSSHRQPP